jgi:hypothetical protein
MMSGRLRPYCPLRDPCRLKVVNDLAQKAPRFILPRAEALGYGFFSKPNVVIIS